MKKSFTQNAALYGLLLACISIVFALISTALNTTTVVSFLLTFLKLVTTISVFWFILKKQANESETFTFGNAVAFGTLTGLFSSFVLAVFALLQATVISPESMELMTDQVMQMYEQMGWSDDSLEMIGSVLNYYPYIIFFGTVIVYTIVGLIYSLIMGSFVKRSDNPFDTPSKYANY